MGADAPSRRAVARPRRERGGAPLAPGPGAGSAGETLRGRPRVAVLEIERARILLDHDGVVEALEIERRDRPPSPPPSVARRIPDPAERRAALDQRLDAWASSDVTGEEIREGLLGESGVEPAYDGAGRLIGLRDGDVVTAVDGIDIDSTDAAPDLMAELALSEQIVLAVDRQDGTRERVAIPTEELHRALDELGGPGNFEVPPDLEPGLVGVPAGEPFPR